MVSSDIQFKVISQDVFMNLTHNMCSEITLLKLPLHLRRANATLLICEKQSDQKGNQN